jgi:hypothetical protein
MQQQLINQRVGTLISFVPISKEVLIVELIENIKLSFLKGNFKQMEETQALIKRLRCKE